jgi:hypothetical protein
MFLNTQYWVQANESKNPDTSGLIKNLKDPDVMTQGNVVLPDHPVGGGTDVGVHIMESERRKANAGDAVGSDESQR